MSDIELDFNDVLILPKYSQIESRKDVCLHRIISFPNYALYIVPLVASNMDLIGTCSMLKELSNYDILTCLHRFHDYWKLSTDLIACERYFDISKSKLAAISIGQDDDINCLSERLKVFPEAIICVDAANGYSQKYIDTVKRVKDKFDIPIMAGNIVTDEGVQLLFEAGADIIRVGIGNGSVCTTRIATKIGRPQISAIQECSQAAIDVSTNDRTCYIMSDGGCTCPGDIVAAYAAGADLVMLGGMLAGHDECELEHTKECPNMPFYGMASSYAMEKYGRFAPHRSSEGKKVYVHYKGKVKNTVEQILNGIKSACSYIGAENISQIQSNSRFVRVNKQVNEVFN